MTRKNRFHLWNTCRFQCGRDKEFYVCMYVKRSTVFAYLSQLSSASAQLADFDSHEHMQRLGRTLYFTCMLCCAAILCVVIVLRRLTGGINGTTSIIIIITITHRKRATRTIHDIIYFNSIFIHKTNCTVGSCFSSSQHVISIRCGFFYCSHILPNI